MRRFLRIAGIVFGALILAAIAAVVFLQGSPSVPAHSDFQLDLATLRELSELPKGGRPIAINASVVEESMVPAAMFLGGIRFDRHAVVFPAYQVLFPDGIIIVDAPPGRDYFDRSFPGKFNDDQFQAVQAALTKAKAIVITHEHADHVGGIAQSPQLSAFVDRLMLSTEQRDDRRWLEDAHFPDKIRTALHPLRYDHYFPLARGVVLIKAPGHTPGSQIVYVRLANDAEYLLIGDVAWDMSQVGGPRCRSRLTELFMGEDSGQVTSELRALHDLAGANGAVHIVVSHDARQLADYQRAGLIGKSFAGL